MTVPLTTADFAYRARTVHGARLGIVDEPGSVGGLGRMTYDEVLRRCDGMIEALEEMGVGQGDRVAVVSPNSAKLLIALLAITGSGRVLVPINFRLGAEELQYIVDDADVSVLLVDAELDESLASVRCRTRVVLDGVEDRELFAAARTGREWPEVAEDVPATINYTSGTTAAPKGAILTHRSHWLNAVTFGWAIGLSEADRYLHTLPTFHVNGWGLPLACAALGVPQVIQRVVRGPEILNRVEAEGITLVCGATPVAATIAQAATDLRASGSAVPGEGRTRMVSGGAATPSAVIAAFERATGWELMQAYGMTEMAPVLTLNRVLQSEELTPARRAERLASVGPPLVGVRLRVDADGEVLARTAREMAGYWHQPELNEAAWRDGWYATGDGGVLVDGRLTITDRKKDVIISGGENVSSLQVEEVLHRHPDVLEAAAIGVPHERWGETVKALVVLRPDAAFDEQALIGFCREALAGFQCPTSIEQRDELPKTASGKLQKHLLRQQYWSASA